MLKPQNKGVTGADLGRALFSPASIAIIGASDDLTKTAARPLQYLKLAGYGGRAYPVNPRRETVLDVRCWPDVASLPERPDHAYIVTPTAGILAALEACGRAGVPVATILGNGFSESGPEGLEREHELLAIAHRWGIRLVGPSSLGVVNLRKGVMITANAAFAEADLPKGRIVVASQSGSMIGALVSRGKVLGTDFGTLVSVGNEADLCIGEICSSVLDDPDVDGFLLFLETLRHADALRSFAIAAAERGKPVLAYKLGRSSEARELAQSHTGALAGEDDVATAFFAECGIGRVETLEGLLEGLPVLRQIPAGKVRGRRPTAGIVTTTGGGAAMVVDQLAIRGVSAVPPSAQTIGRFEAAGIAIDGSRIIDLTLAGTRYDVMKAALDILLDAAEYDIVIAVVGSSARFQPHLAVRPVIDCAGAEKPLAAFLVPEAGDALRHLRTAGIPAFRTPEACGDAVAAAFRRRVPSPLVPNVSEGRTSRQLDEDQSYARLEAAGLPSAPRAVIDTGTGIHELPQGFFPAALKILSADVAHKSDIGGVRLAIPDPASLRREAAAMIDRVRVSGGLGSVDRLLVQPMQSGVGEALLGYRVDPDVGPLVLVASGGILTEIYADRSLRLAPVDLATAHEMIGEVKAFRALIGYRGKHRGDLDALALAIVQISRLADDPSVAEAEVNPLVIRREGDGVVAVDAVLRVWNDEAAR
jgi:acyl-CoA synthetase (NDP forming)